MTDSALLSAFESATLPEADWHHAQHVRVAWMILREEPTFDAALDRLRKGIKRLNASFGLVEDPSNPTRGYHETLTRAYLTVIDATIRRDEPEADSLAFLERHHYLTTRLLLLFYSRERITLPEAKSRFVEPDLMPLPA